MAITPTTSWAKANLAMAITFIPVTWLVVFMRFIVRRKIKAVGADDWLMLAGLVSYCRSRGGVIVCLSGHADALNPDCIHLVLPDGDHSCFLRTWRAGYKPDCSITA